MQPSNSNIVAIIDDDEVFLLLTKKMLEQKKAADIILEFSNAYTGLMHFTNNAGDISQLPSVVLLDLFMPGMSGWQFLKQLRSIKFPPDYVPSVFIISGSENIDFERMRDYPFIKGYIIKPVAPSKLIAAVESAKIGC